MEEKELHFLLEQLRITLEEYKYIETFGYTIKQLKQKYEEFGITAEELKQGLFKEVYDYTHPRDRFKHHLLTDWMQQHCFVIKVYDDALPQDKAVLHLYEHGKYYSSKKFMEGYMLDLIPSLTAAQRKEVISTLEASRKTPLTKKAEPQFIPFKSDIYDIVNDVHIPYSQEYVMLNKLPYDYKKNAAPQRSIDNFLDLVSDGDKEIKQLLLEAFGSCFYTRNDYRGSFWLVGNGKNGKSTALNMLQQMLGQSNVSHLSAQAMNGAQGRFRIGELYTAMANLGDDIPSEYITDDSILKMAITGEALTSETKHDANLFPFIPYAKLFFAMNEAPRIGDNSAGLYTRIKIIPFTHDFSKNDDVRIKSRHWTDAEMEYLVKLSVEAFKGVMQRGNFIEPTKVAAELAEYKEMNSPIVAFVNDCYDSSEELEGAITTGVYQRYREWCEKNCNKCVTKNMFTRNIKREYGLNAKTAFINGHSQRIFTK